MVRDVGGYRVERLLGRGGSAEVWRARHRRTGDVVALKRLRPRNPDAGDRPRQLHEAQLLAAVDHPHLVALHEVFEDDGDPVLVLDHLPGGSLADLVARRGALEAGEVVTVLAPVAAALAYAHDEGLVHGDVTPANVLFSGAGRPVLSDLGLARVLGEPADPTVVLCTPAFADPQVVTGVPPSVSSDVFGLAATALFALTGVPLWGEGSAQECLAAACSGPGPDVGDLLPGAPAELVEVLSRALDPQPAERGTAAEFALDLRHSCPPRPVDFAGTPEVSAGIGIVTHAVRRPRPEGPSHAASEPDPPRWRPVLAVASAVLVVLAAVVLGLRWGQDSAPAASAPPVRPASAATSPTPDPALRAVEFGVPTSPGAWAEVLGLLYQRRVAAFSAGDPDLLAGVYTVGSAQAASDRTELDRLAAAGRRVGDFTPVVRRVDRVTGVAPEVTLQVHDAFGPWTVTADGAVVESHAGRGPVPVELRLVLTAVGWRIESARRLAT